MIVSFKDKETSKIWNREGQYSIGTIINGGFVLNGKIQMQLK